MDQPIDKYQKLLELSEGNYQAFLYDCDGTLADNMQAHKDAYVATAKGYGFDLNDNIIDELAGYPTVMVSAEIARRYKIDFDANEFADRKSRIFFQEFIPHTRPIDFVVKHLLAHSGKVRIGVVSGGRKPTVQKTLETLGILDKVEALVCAGDTPNGKPSPEPFLLAAKLLEVDPAACMVFEDGDAGVQSANAAGMKWIRIDLI